MSPSCNGSSLVRRKGEQSCEQQTWQMSAINTPFSKMTISNADRKIVITNWNIDYIIPITALLFRPPCNILWYSGSWMMVCLLAASHDVVQHRDLLHHVASNYQLKPYSKSLRAPGIGHHGGSTISQNSRKRKEKRRCSGNGLKVQPTSQINLTTRLPQHPIFKQNIQRKPELQLDKAFCVNTFPPLRTLCTVYHTSLTVQAITRLEKVFRQWLVGEAKPDQETHFVYYEPMLIP